MTSIKEGNIRRKRQRMIVKSKCALVWSHREEGGDAASTGSSSSSYSVVLGLLVDGG